MGIISISPNVSNCSSRFAHAVQHAHQKGIIHRDLKPNNILVSTQDDRPFAKVIDFGIAKATASRLTEKTLFTEHRALIGTPEYMSPEQAGGSLDIDTRTDVYSLGVLLYELLTGSTPFDGGGLRHAAYDEIERVIREVDPPKPSTRLSASLLTIRAIAAHRRTEPKRLGVIVRGELDWIVMKALEKDRARRYESASALADDIIRHGAGTAVIAAPPSAVYRLRKFARRYRTSLATTAAVVSVLVGGIIASWIEANRAHVAERKVGAQLEIVQHAETVAQQQTSEAQRRLKEANEANQRAEAALRTVKLQNSNHFVDLGLKEWERKEYAYAALWFIQALKLDQGNPERERMQRYRIGSSFANCPRPYAPPVPPIPATSPAGRELWWDEKSFSVTDAASGAVISRATLTANVSGHVLGASGQTVITMGADRSSRASFWDANHGTQIGPDIPLHVDVSPDFSDDRNFAAFPSSDGVRIFDTRNGQALDVLPDKNVHYTRFSPDAKTVVTVSNEPISQSTSYTPDAYARLWNLGSGKAIGGELRRKDALISHIDFAARGATLMCRWTNATAQLWNTDFGDLAATLDKYDYFLNHERDAFYTFKERTLDVLDARTARPKFAGVEAAGNILSGRFPAATTRRLPFLPAMVTRKYSTARRES